MLQSHAVHALTSRRLGVILHAVSDERLTNYSPQTRQRQAAQNCYATAPNQRSPLTNDGLINVLTTHRISSKGVRVQSLWQNLFVIASALLAHEDQT